MINKSSSKNSGYLKFVVDSIIEFPGDIIIFSLDRNYCYTSFNTNYIDYLKDNFDVTVEIGDNFLEVFKDYQDVNKEKSNFDRALEGVAFSQIGNDIQGEQTYYYKDIYKPVLDKSTGEVFGIIVYYTNITGRKRSERVWEALLNISEKVSTSKNLRDFILYIRNQLSKIIDTTNFFVALYEQETNTYTFPFFTDERDKIQKFTSYNLLKSTTDYVRRIGKPLILNIEKTNKLVNSNEIDIIGTPSPSWLGVPLKNEGKTIGVMVCQSYDREGVYSGEDAELIAFISGHIARAVERKQFEQELKEAKEKAEESDKLKSAFLANMSHEIRTPMNAIIGFSNLISKADLPDKTRDKYATYISNSANNLLKLINDIMDVAKIEAGEIVINKESANINSILEEIYFSMLQERTNAKKNHIEIKLNLSVKTNNFFIDTDPLRLRQILINLLNNALKFTTDGYIEFGYYFINPKTLEFYVKDTGCGISKKYENLIFSRFGQVLNKEIANKGGTGLGLSISKHLVEALGGNIRFDSVSGEGTCFYFTTPFVSGVEVKKEEKNIEINTLPENLKIFIVEDNKINQILINDILVQNTKNSNIIFAETGAEAIYKFNKNKTKSEFDIIFMDIKLPDIDGYEVTKYIRNNENKGKKVAIIGLSAHAMKEAKDKGLQSGMDDFISKPIILKELFEVIRKHILPTKKKKTENYKKKKKKTENYKYIDLSILAPLYKNNKEKFTRIIKLYTENIQVSINNLAEIIELENREEIEGLAHNLKSALLYLGLKRASKKAELIEQNAYVGNSYISPKFKEIQEIWKNAYAEIKENFYN